MPFDSAREITDGCDEAMFVGHYSASLAAKAVDRTIPLWSLFLAAQLVDVGWAILISIGVERVRIIPGFTRANPLDLYFMPYTHSLVAALVWSALATIAYKQLRRGAATWKAALIFGAVVLSHWVLDLLVHKPDLPLYGDQHKLGLGLWDHPVLSMGLESLLLLAALAAYLRSTVRVAAGGRSGMLLFCMIMLVIQLVNMLGPPPASARALGASALLAYGLFAAAAGWLERRRV